MFFLTRAELLAALTEGEPAGNLASAVVERRKLWQRQRRLASPLVLGEMTAMMKRIFESSANMLRAEGRPSGGNGLAGPLARPA